MAKSKNIIQIAVSSPSLSESTTIFQRFKRTAEPTLLALCDDSTVWAMDLSSSANGTGFRQWLRVPDIPDES